MAEGDFDIDGLAAYLHIAPQQVMRLADRGKLPGRKVAGQWRFHRADIHHWLETRIGVSCEEELLEVEGVLQRAAPSAAEEEVSIAALLPMEAIAIPLAARTKPSVIRDMVDLVTATGLLWDPEKMAEAVRCREELHPTALDNGVALLHPRRPMASILGGAVLALGRTPTGIPFGGSRGLLTDVYFLICSVDDAGHLRVLARLSRLIGVSGFLDRLRDVDSAASARALIAETEQTL